MRSGREERRRRGRKKGGRKNMRSEMRISARRMRESRGKNIMMIRGGDERRRG